MSQMFTPFAQKIRILPLFILASGSLLLSKVHDLCVGAPQSLFIAPAVAQAPRTDAQAPAPSAHPTQAVLDPLLQTRSPKEEFDILELTPEHVALLRRLSERRTKIEERAAEVNKKRLELDVIEQRVDQKVQRMEELRAHLQQLVVAREELEKKDTRKLVSMYEKMKPKEAARILEGLNMDTLVQLLVQFNEAKAAAVLASMSPAKARVATTWLINRRQIDGFHAEVPGSDTSQTPVR